MRYILNMRRVILFLFLLPAVSALGEAEVRLFPSHCEAGGNYGHAVALSGDLALIGAFAEDSGSGAAYVFAHGTSNWT